MVLTSLWQATRQIVKVKTKKGIGEYLMKVNSEGRFIGFQITFPRGILIVVVPKITDYLVK